MRILQIAHLALIAITAGLYAWLMAILPPEDVWRVRISAAAAVALAIWAALLFIEMLRTGEPEGLKERILNAYRRLLNRAPSLMASTAILAAAAGGMAYLAGGYGEIEFSSDRDQDVTVYLSDPGKEPERVAVVPARKRVTTRLATGRRWIYFATLKEKSVPYRTGKIDVLPPWRKHEPQTVPVPEVPKYAGN